MACGAASVTVATDHAEIAACVHRQGGKTWMSDQSYASGSDRVAAVARAMAWSPDTMVVNIQADEVSISAEDVKNLCTALQAKPQAAMVTLAKTRSMEDQADFGDPNAVKVVCCADGRALYFSRAPIPYRRSDADGAESRREEPTPQSPDALAFCKTTVRRWHHHMGVYAYRCRYLERFSRLPRSFLERLERLEQLRALDNKDLIYVLEAASSQPHGVDSPSDLQALEENL